MKIKAFGLVDTIWLLSARLGCEVIKNNSFCHYPNNSVGLSDCNPTWPFVILSATITRLHFHDLWRANSPPNKGQNTARALCTSWGEQGAVAMPGSISGGLCHWSHLNNFHQEPAVKE